MTNNLIKHFDRYIEVDLKNETEFSNLFEYRVFKKKENLIEQDSMCKFHFFVVKGCLRMFFIDEKGSEQTIQFAIENWWITDYLAFDQQHKTNFSIQAVEETEVFMINYQNQEVLLQNYPKMEKYFRLIYQRAYAASQLRIKYLFNFSREDFYNHFNHHFPEFTKRVPQHLLASYLNMTPEYLSEIKNKSKS